MIENGIRFASCQSLNVLCSRHPHGPTPSANHGTGRFWQNSLAFRRIYKTYQSAIEDTASDAEFGKIPSLSTHAGNPIRCKSF
jgi:hypothetical protein